MRYRDFFAILFPNLFEAVLVLLLAILIPTIILLLYWDASVHLVMQILPFANEQQKLAEVILIIVPLASLYFATGFLFIYRTGRSGGVMGKYAFFVFFFLPVTGLLVSQPILFAFVVGKKAHQVLEADDMFTVTVCLGSTVLFLLLIETYMSISSALTEMPGLKIADFSSFPSWNR
jgi:hypothetical protein